MTVARRGALALTVALGLWAGPAAAAPPHKVLVLPAAGSADAATRGRVTAQVARLAHRLDGQVATGDATFADAALAVGCDPDATGCSDEVMATLGVDELVWATASKDAGQTRVVVRRAARGTPTREQAAVVPAGGSNADRSDRIDAQLAPLFVPPADPASPVAGAPGDAPSAPSSAAPAVNPGAPAPALGLEVDHAQRDRTTAIAFGVGSAAALALGITLWVSYAELQDSIDHHATRTRFDIDDLISLEDRASTRAIAGDVFVIAGLAAGGVAAYFVLRDHHAHGVALAPAPIAHGAGVVLSIPGGI